MGSTPLQGSGLQLGVHLDSALLDKKAGGCGLGKWGGGAFHHLSLVHHLCSFLEKSGLVIVTHELVTSRFDYCDAIYGGLPLERVWEFQLVQNGVSQYTETRNSSIKGVALAPYSFPSKGSD